MPEENINLWQLSSDLRVKLEAGKLQLYNAVGEGIATPDIAEVKEIFRALSGLKTREKLVADLRPLLAGDPATLFERLRDCGILINTDAENSLFPHVRQKQLLALILEYLDLNTNLHAAHFPQPEDTLFDELCLNILELLFSHYSLIETAHPLHETVNPNVRRLNIGAGSSKSPGWTSVDLSPNADYRFDLRREWPVEKDSIQYIYIGHVLEHFDHTAALQVLGMAKKCLLPQGRIRIAVPDAEKWLRAYSNDDKKFFSEVRKVWKEWPENLSPLQLTMEYLGGGETLSRLTGHRSSFDWDVLKSALMKAGFKDIQKAQFGAGHPELAALDTHMGIANLASNPDMFTLYAEAT